ncbi:hypothetical protein ACJVDH_12170 [Pedobacter sp. AW1-32]|uniref:hypothetical protein n=1 Tax=Pedobacter sp. AW1-32 TaxID=3383026 RepID=UPI003FEEEF27
MDKQSTENLQTLLNELNTNARLRFEQIKLNVIVQASRITADLLTNIVVALSLILAFLFATVTLGFFLSTVFNSYSWGFGGLTLVYLIIALAVAKSSKKYIEPAMINFSIGRYFKKHFANNDH